MLMEFSHVFKERVVCLRTQYLWECQVFEAMWEHVEATSPGGQNIQPLSYLTRASALQGDLRIVFQGTSHSHALTLP